MMYKTFESFSTSFWIYKIIDGWNTIPYKACNLPMDDKDITIYFNKRGFLLYFYILHRDIGSLKLVADITPYVFKNIFVAINCDVEKQIIELYTGMNTGVKNEYERSVVKFNNNQFTAYRKHDIFLVNINGKDLREDIDGDLTVAAELLSETLEIGRYKLIKEVNGVILKEGLELSIPRNRIMPIYTLK